MSWKNRLLIVLSMVCAGAEALVAARGAWPAGRVAGYFLGGVLLSCAVGWVGTRGSFSAARFVRLCLWTSAGSLLLTLAMR